ncbi:hypothetical protein AKJ09_08074 [Labilithrix luteola]|uniref:Uncharacterized protein n=1 Tax=Labilithrix luteola TaxID=1391654 RepID=A0A0K1Q6E8_9BACT|nr:hypothetical protein [Labilithrix luteola]AKV01411.1 hypothetical protein AKJ09_08074 [Labilithrix luteola]
MRLRVLAPFVVTGIGSSILFGLAAAACSSSDSNLPIANQPVAPAPTPSSSSSTSKPASPEGGDAAEPANPEDECVLDTALCIAKDRSKTCKKTDQGTRWVEDACAAGSGCFQGACAVGACSDECTLGESQGGKTCGLWDVTKGSAAALPDPVASMHDRSRGYLAFMSKGPMVTGGIGSPHYADPPNFTQLDYMGGLGDSAIWTGTYLAAESARLIATGSADARARVRSLVDTIHLFMNVSGEPGILARWTKESSKTYPFPTGDLACGQDTRSHCNVPYDGKNYDYVGGISRDQYQGVMLGYGLAYEALGPADEDKRDVIRRDVVMLVEELMKERTVSVKVTYDGFTVTPTNLTLRFAVLDPREMKDGAISIVIKSADLQGGEMRGFQEFTPDLADLLKQIPLLSWAPPIYRQSSAVMLASFFRVAIAVTDGVPSYKARHDAILNYYYGHTGAGGNVNDWLKVAVKPSTSAACGDSYYANNIMWEPLYNLARLEDSAGYKSRVRDELMKTTLWPEFVNTKNSFFSFIYAAHAPGGDADAASKAATQLAQFPPAPRTHPAVDLRSTPKYQHSATCTDQCIDTDAVDVGDRPAEDFLWQRHPWSLYRDANPGQVEPGVDYLVAYWLGRRHAFLQDDKPGVCLAYQ